MVEGLPQFTASQREDSTKIHFPKQAYGELPSRKTWVYFLIEKLEAFGTFKSYKARVEKETRAFIRSLRTDRGGEFTSHEFTNFCHENGIHRQLTAAYSPQQNDVAKRKNRTIMNIVQSMLLAKQIPKTFWPEVVNWTVHVLNQCPTLAMKNKTPEEAWNAHKPYVDHFRIFGCIAHVHIPDTKRVNLDAKSCKCILLGVSEESKAYRLFDLVLQKVIISRDVVFEEDQQWSWNDSHKKAITADLEWDTDEENSTIREESELESGTDEVVGETESETNSGSLIEENIQPDEISPRMERIQRPPIWMRDYETCQDISDDESASMAHLALLINQDPTTFEDAVKCEKWRQAMDQEIQAIEKNNTWELMK
ncbi:unnamed protein product [Prunus armeniaca]